MITVDLEAVFKLVSRKAVLLVTPEDKEFCLAEADDFEREVETLRGSQAFQWFLEERSVCTKRISLEDIEAEIERELADQ